MLPKLVKSFTFKSNQEFVYVANQLTTGSAPVSVVYDLGHKTFLPHTADVPDGMERIFNSYSAKRIKKITRRFHNFRLKVIRQTTGPSAGTPPVIPVAYDILSPPKFEVSYFYCGNLLKLDNILHTSSGYKHVIITGPDSGWSHTQHIYTGMPTEHDYAQLKSETSTEEKYNEFMNFIQRQSSIMTTASIGAGGILNMASSGTGSYFARPAQYQRWQIGIEAQWPPSEIDLTPVTDAASPNMKVKYHLLFDVTSEVEFSMWHLRVSTAA